MANLTDSQLESIYNAAYAASDAWKKEREDLIEARDRYKSTCEALQARNKALEDRTNALEQDIEELARANQQLANQRDQDLNALDVATDELEMYRQSLDYWKRLYEEASDDRYKLKQELSNLKLNNACNMETTLSTEQRVTTLESTVSINSEDIYNLLLRVSKLETNK
jgi:chromosome segregation ATPase